MFVTMKIELIFVGCFSPKLHPYNVVAWKDTQPFCDTDTIFSLYTTQPLRNYSFKLSNDTNDTVTLISTTTI